MLTEYNIVYHTHNTYEAPVQEALFEFLVSPCPDATQTITKVTFYNSLGVEVYHHKNTFGFQRDCIRSVKPFTELEFSMTATVLKAQPTPIGPLQMTFAEEEALLQARDFYIDHHLFLEFGKYTTIDEQYADQILKKQSDQSVYNYLWQLNQHINGMLEYDTDPTDVHTTASEVLELGKGVCQDYAHLFIAMARHNHIPCRYVSGYLNQGPNLQGGAVMHAWAEGLIPGYGWYGFDPTNNYVTDVNHIKTAHGVDYSDCSPIKGILKTNGGNSTDYKVEVKQMQMAEAAQ